MKIIANEALAERGVEAARPLPATRTWEPRAYVAPVRQQPLYETVKRLFDILLSLLGILVLSPVFLLTALAIKFTDKGKIIYKQLRVGKNGREFVMYKFRSMVENADQLLDAVRELNECDGPVFKIRNDPRLTKVGAFIRKFSIDELPQLVNVLKGDMSLVGPRPPLPSEVREYSEYERGRLAVTPGLSCYWQICGRSDVSFAEWVEMDLRYIRERGLLTDLKIILKTFPAVFGSRGAY